MFHYRAYQINFASDIEFPWIAPTDDDLTLPTVTIRRGEVPEFLDSQQDNNSYYQVEPHRILLKIDGVARYLITHGREITVAPAREAHAETVLLFLLGSAMGALLYQRDLLPLHGSAIETPWGAMVFVGPQGIGKSTLAAHFQRRGYRILSDDVCVLARDGSDHLQVLPAFPKLRLCPDALERLGKSTENLPRARFDGDKFMVPVSTGHCPRPVSLGTIHLLSASEDPQVNVKPSKGFSRIDHLIANLYRPEYLHGMASEANILRLAFSITRQTGIVEIAHNRDPDRIEELIDRLEREWLHSSTSGHYD